MIKNQVYETILDFTDVPDEDVKEETTLKDDLHLNSLELTEIFFILEGEFGVMLPDDIVHQLNTVGDVIEIFSRLLSVFRIGDKVMRVDENPGENYVAWQHLSINQEYEIEYVLENGFVTLKNFLILVDPKEIKRV